MPSSIRRAARVRLAAALFAVFSAGAALAEPPACPGAAVLRLQATASDQVRPDVAVATLAAVREGNDVAALNATVVGLLDDAMRQARATPGIEASSGGYTTQPRDTPGPDAHRDGWTVRGQLVLRATDFAALGRAVGTLGSTLQVESLRSEVSPALRERERAALTARAIADFRRRAAEAAQGFGSRSYTLHEVEIGSLSGDGPGPVRMFATANGGAAPVDPAARELSISVNGSVCIKP